MCAYNEKVRRKGDSWISRVCIVYEIKLKRFRRKIKSQVINAKIFRTPVREYVLQQRCVVKVREIIQSD